MSVEQVWRGKPDDEVVAAAGSLYNYTADAERIIREELTRRGLKDAPPPVGTCLKCQRVIHANHPGSECLQCGTPISAEVQPLLPAPAVGPKGIRGWLLLPAFGLILRPIQTAVYLSGAFPLWANVGPGGYGRVLALDLLVESAFLVFLVVGAIRFFRKKRNAPSTLLAYMSARIVVSALLLAIYWLADLQFAQAQIAQLWAWALFGGVWGTYFTKSRRVKATFVN